MAKKKKGGDPEGEDETAEEEMVSESETVSSTPAPSTAQPIAAVPSEQIKRCKKCGGEIIPTYVPIQYPLNAMRLANAPVYYCPACQYWEPRSINEA